MTQTTRPSVGRVALVGAGPGDPELITVKGARLLREADVVIYDNLVGGGILDFTSPTAERIFVGKMAGNHTLPQEDICQLLVDKALAGKFVVRLKGGDPFVFGRGGEELDVLMAAGIHVEIVPRSCLASRRHRGVRPTPASLSPTAIMPKAAFSSPAISRMTASI